MIIDVLKNAQLYYGLNQNFSTAFKFLYENDFNKIKPGDYEIGGNKIYVKVKEYDTKTGKKDYWEAHRQYIDIQYIAEGEEYIGYSNINKMRECQYIEEKDQIVLEGQGDFFKIEKDFFTILFPQDAHMPAVAMGKPLSVKKIIIKVKI